MTAPATTRPWRVEDGASILGADDYIIADLGMASETSRDVPNAALIVRAVNAFDDLVAAADALLAKELERHGLGCWTNELEALRAALAKAREP